MLIDISVKLESLEVTKSIFGTNWHKMNAQQTEIPEIRIRKVDPETHKTILDEQTRQKKERGINQFSMSSTIKLIVREWKKCKEKE